MQRHGLLEASDPLTSPKLLTDLLLTGPLTTYYLLQRHGLLPRSDSQSDRSDSSYSDTGRLVPNRVAARRASLPPPGALANPNPNPNPSPNPPEPWLTLTPRSLG